MEEEGIFYFFEHSEEGHKLILADDSSAIEDCPAQSAYRVATSPEAWLEEDVIHWLEREHQVYTTTVTLTDYDDLQPSMDLESTASDADYQELYDYPGKYSKLSDGERYTRLLLEERAAGQETVTGEGSGRAMRSGYTFDLEDHYRADTNQAYFLLSVWHTAASGGYRAGEGGTEYSNRIECIPSSVPYRPPRDAVKPVVRGTQPALVVGPSGEEIYTDKYGRVKVQFYWDREGQKNENSSCWIRVSHPWAGAGWGAVAIPRIGQEVIVDFLEGDPDRPIITGRVYNAERMPPYALPDQGVVSGIKSDSHKASGYNEISMNDTAGEEKIIVHAQYDMEATVEHDDKQEVKNDRTIAVAGNQTETIKKDSKTEVDGEWALEVEKDTSTKVKSGDLTVKTDSGSIKEESAAGHTIESDADIEMKGANIKAKADAQVTVDGMKIALSGMTEVVLSVGGNSVKIDPSGVTITGILVRIN
jgi:type VI secretion system secreted protein VgrG